MKKYTEIRVPSRMSLSNLIFGDFDRDGMKNIDDPQPFNPRIKRAPLVQRNYKRYHTAKYADPEVRLSAELMAIKKYNDSHARALHSVLTGRHAYGRVKTVPSTLHKLRERYIHKIGDVVGATHVTANRAEAYGARRELRRRFQHIRHRSDDFYKKPKAGVYYALHDTYNIGGRKIEVQFKSRHMKKLAEKTHTAYKYGHPMHKYRQMGEDLFRRGY